MSKKDFRLDLTGQKFNNLLVLESLGSNENGHTIWKCLCDCGKIKIAVGKEIKRGKLKSCGCLRGVGGRFEKKHGDYNTKFYNTWIYIKRRCNNNKRGYENISYDPKWENYESFKKEMYFKFVYVKKKYRCDGSALSIERLNNKENYCFSNCIFILLNEQNKNKGNVHRFIAISPTGRKYIAKNASQFAEQHNLNPNHLRECIRGEAKSHKGWRFKRIGYSYGR